MMFLFPLASLITSLCSKKQRQDGDQIRKQFLVHLLNYINNEAAHNILDVYENSLALLGNTGIIFWLYAYDESMIH